MSLVGHYFNPDAAEAALLKDLLSLAITHNVSIAGLSAGLDLLQSLSISSFHMTLGDVLSQQANKTELTGDHAHQGGEQ